MCYSNFFINTAKKLSLLYSSVHFGFNFEKLVDSLLSHDGPTLILLVHNEASENAASVKPKTCPYIFGGFVKPSWQNSDSYQGSDDSYIFSLIPKFQSLYALKHIEADRNYNYLNKFGSQGKEAGIGKVDVKYNYDFSKNLKFKNKKNI